MSRPRVWDVDELRRLGAEGLTADEMAARLGCDRRALITALSRYGIDYARVNRGRPARARSAPPPEPPDAREAAPSAAPKAPPRGLAGAEADIFMAGPSWGGIARAAARHGLSTAEAQRVWHRVRGMA